MNIPRNATTLLFNPFVLVAGGKSLFLGLAGMLLAGWIGSLSHTHFDGVLDTHHIGGPAPAWVFFAEGIINWLSLSLPLGVAGLLCTKTKFRWIDLLGTQALARWPALLIALISLAPGYHRFSKKLLEQIRHAGATPPPFSGPDAAVFLSVIVGILLLTCWMVFLMYRSFAVSCNVRGGKAAGAFITALILGEVLSKVLLSQLFLRI